MSQSIYNYLLRCSGQVSGKIMNDHKPVMLTKTTARQIDGDDVWTFLGPYGKFQIIQIVSLFIASLNISTSILCGLFVGGHVDFRCARGNTTALGSPNLTVVEMQCSTQIYDNNTSQVVREEPCSEYEFDGDGKTLSYIAEWSLVCDYEAKGQLAQSLTMAGMGIGAFTLPHIGDQFGRKKLAVVSCICLLAVSLTIAFVQQFELFLFLKLLSGIFNQGRLIPLNVLVLEIFPTCRRSTAALINITFWASSLLLTGIIGYFMRDYEWRIQQLAYALMYSTVAIEVFLMEESLRWLLANSKVKQTEKVIKKACSMNDKDYDTLLSTVVNEKKEKPQTKYNEDKQELLSPVKGSKTTEVSDSEIVVSSSFLSIFKNRFMRRITIIMCFTWMMCSLTYYGLILLSTSLGGNKFVNYFIAAALEWPAGLLMFLSINRFGRQRTILAFQTLTGSSLLCAVLVANLAPKGSEYTSLQTFFTMCGLFFVSGNFNAVWIFTPELYPTNFRNVGIGVASCTARVGAVFSPFITTLARQVLWAPCALFATGCFISAFLLTFVPETKWRELPKTISDVEGWILCDKNRNEKRTASKQGDSEL